nr:sensor domain-containing diguanylate cyclase [Vibrio coralliirubri]
MPFGKVLEEVRDAVVLVNSKHQIKYHNNAFLRIIGSESEETFVGKEIWGYYASANPYIDYQSLYSTSIGLGQVDFAVRRINQTLKLGVARLIELDSDLYLLLIEDSSVQKERETKLIREAKSDKLTGLLNRKGFDERLAAALQGYDPKSGYSVGVLFIDLDEFKPINDTFGHDAGDLMLIAVAERLNASVEDYETTARIGGDEFVCILPVCESLDEVAIKGEKILGAVAQPVDASSLGLSELIVKCSIGGALVDPNDISANSLLKRADEAMYTAKKSGKNKISVI